MVAKLFGKMCSKLKSRYEKVLIYYKGGVNILLIK